MPPHPHTEPPLTRHTALHARYAEEEALHDRRAAQLAFANLGIALAILVFGITGFSTDDWPWFVAAGASGLAFLAVRVRQTQAFAGRDWASVRKEVHARHLARMSGHWRTWPATVLGPPEHPFALDIDLLGRGSLVQFLDVTHTAQGEAQLLAWLSAPAAHATLRDRQRAVRELAETISFRESLEAAACLVQGAGKLDEKPFLLFVEQQGLFEARPYLRWVRIVGPASTGLLVALWLFQLVPGALPLIAICLQALVAWITAGWVNQRFDLVATRRGFAESYLHLLRAVEEGAFSAPLLQQLKDQLSEGGTRPSRQFAGLDRWAGLSDLRYQVLAHIPINWIFLWDLHVLFQLERWTKRNRKNFRALFEAVGTFEALSSLATLLSLDEGAILPTLLEDSSALDPKNESAPPSHAPLFEAAGLAHPLLPPKTRVANDVALPARGALLVVTGSNMAGKSTLLRAVGLNLSLALAGGPVCATHFSCGRFRLRASMRAEDDLGEGASYFHAELKKLRTVVADAEGEPPIFFLLDELLRGTNAKARHLGARAVLEHLLDRGGLGLVATHDTQLAAMAEARPSLVRNVHFTDVVVDGEMTFDYRLRDGVVTTSNALRLLELAGIAVPEEALRLMAEGI